MPVPEFLSDAWIKELDAQLNAAPATSSPQPLTIQYVIDRSDGPPSEYHLELGPDGGRARTGRCIDPSVVFTMDEGTALAISTGEVSSEEAFINGDLELEGDPTLLINAYRAEPGA